MHTGGASRGRVCGCGCWRYWHMKSERRHVTCDTWHLTHDTWLRKTDNKFKSILFRFFCIGDTIPKCWEIRCFLYAGFCNMYEFVWLFFKYIFCSIKPISSHNPKEEKKKKYTKIFLYHNLFHGIWAREGEEGLKKVEKEKSLMWIISI